MTPPVLVCTTHDPSGAVLRLATEEALQAIVDLFGACTVACSAESTADVEPVLHRSGVKVVRKGGERLDLYRAALASGADAGEYVMYADFDRLLHWQRSYPAELEEIARREPRPELTIVGRTARAFDSHPACQRLTEGPSNELFRHLFEVPPDTDVFASCWILGRRAAAYLLDAPVAPGTAFYALWPAMLLRAGFGLSYLAAEGLEWETPDAHTDDIVRLGFDAWHARFESSDQWLQRAEMGAQWVTELLRLASTPVGERS